ncbi:Non-structural maintenance of chromosomes element 4-like protein A [Bienertia sinuspersici]
MEEQEPLITMEGVDEAEFLSTKSEKVNKKSNRNNEEPPPKRRRSTQTGEPVELSPVDRRVLRSHYEVIKNIINGQLNVEEKEELCKGDPVRFQKIMGEVNRLHEHVSNPREQVTDAETLLEMSSILLATVRSYSRDGLTPSDFISSLIREFGVVGGRRVDNGRVSIKWNDVGVLVCPIFMKAQGCPTMIGPMNAQVKQRKAYTRKSRTKLNGSAAKPEQLEDSGSEHKKDTDKNMATMFNILRSKKHVNLENLILNKFSFAQTVENLFALSFLVKDGRAQVVVDDKGNHILMVDSVVSGEELMPHRYQVSIPMSQEETVPVLTPVAIPTSQLTEVVEET